MPTEIPGGCAVVEISLQAWLEQLTLGAAL